MTKWTPTEISYLIDLMEVHNFLFDVKHKNYFNRAKREAALADMASKMVKVKPNVTVDLIRKKARSLRDCYRKERKLVDQSRQCETDGGKIYEPRLPYYSRLHFTYINSEARQSESSASIETTTDELILPDTPATPTTIFSDAAFEDTIGSIHQTSQSRSPAPETSQAAESFLSAGNEQNNGTSKRRQGVSDDRDKAFLAFLGSELRQIEDDDILRVLMQRLLSEVFAAQVRQKDLTKRQRRTTSHPPPPETVYPTCSSPIPSFSACVFQRRFPSPSASATSSPILSSRSCTPEVSTSVKSTHCSSPFRPRTPTISLSSHLLTRPSRPPIVHSTLNPLPTSTNMEEFPPDVCITAPSTTSSSFSCSINTIPSSSLPQLAPLSSCSKIPASIKLVHSQPQHSTLIITPVAAAMDNNPPKKRGDHTVLNNNPANINFSNIVKVEPPADLDVRKQLSHYFKFNG